MDQSDKLISMTEAARLLAVNRSTLSSWLKQGRIPAIQYGPGGLYRLRRGDVLAYIDAHRLVRRGEADDAGAEPPKANASERPSRPGLDRGASAGHSRS